MDHEIDGADGECQPTPSNTNVRVKVSSWVTSFVSEMRTKSPAVVQRWVDSLPNETVTDIVPDDIAVEADNNSDHTDSHTPFDNTGNSCLENCENIIANKIECNNVDDIDIVKQVNELNVHVHANKSDDNHDHHHHDDGNKTTLLQASQPICVSENQHANIEAGGLGGNANDDRRFWQKGASVLTALRIRSASATHDSNRRPSTEAQRPDLNASPQLTDSDTQSEHTNTSTKPLINKSKLNDIYHKLSINKKRYNFIKERRMDAKKLLSDAKSRLLAATNWDETDVPKCDQEMASGNELMASSIESSENATNSTTAQQITAATTTTQKVPETTAAITPIGASSIATEAREAAAAATTTTISEPERSGAALAVCDTSDMDLSADELSSSHILSADDEDSFNVPSIDSHHTTHLNVGRRIGMADIGRSTSDNPRLRNKYYLADIGRSFSEHQDEEAILIGDHRNISAPSSSIAIQNNNRSNSSFFERRAYSVSPTQRGLKRGILSRDHSLSDSSRHRNQLSKGSSFQSDSSHCSSVESLLDARKPDSEAILRQLGFGPAHQEDLLSRIPKRFLKPSQVPGIDTEAFMRQQAIANNLHEQSILGYRGLTGDPHVIPAKIVAKIMERFQLSDESGSKFYDVFNDGRPMSAPPTPGPNDLSDLRHPEP